MKKLLLSLIALLPLAGHAEELKLLTWNVFMFPKPINFSLQNIRTPMIAKALDESPYDVILMQEAWLGSFRSQVGRTLAKKFPYQEHLSRVRRPFKFLNSGLFLVSKHPVEVLGHWYFNSCTHSDCLASKGVLLTELTLRSGKKVQIAFTHAQAWEDAKAVTVRAQQFQNIKRLLEKHAKPNVAQILAGDFNIDGKLELEYPQLLELLGMSSRPLDGELDYTSGFHIPCYKTPGGVAQQWLDHVWLNPRETQAEVSHKAVRPFTGLIRGVECSLSDHYAVEATVSL